MKNSHVGTDLAWCKWDSTQVQFLCVTGQLCGIPVHLILLAGAVLHQSRVVDERHRQPATVCQVPAACMPPLHHCWVPTPMIRGETLEYDADVYPCKGQRQEAEHGKDSPLTAAK